MVENVKIKGEGRIVHNVGASQGFIGITVKYGEYDNVTDVYHGHPTVTTQWKFSDEEIGRMLMGAVLEIELFGDLWPPSMLSVGDIPKQET